MEKPTALRLSAQRPETHGTEGHKNHPAQRGGLEGKKNSDHTKSDFAAF